MITSWLKAIGFALLATVFMLQVQRYWRDSRYIALGFAVTVPFEIMAAISAWLETVP